MAQFVAYQLSPLANSPINVKNSEDLAKFVSEQQLPRGYILISLDVVSLFTNVPIDLAIQEIGRRFGEIEQSTSLDCDELKKLVEFCLTTGYFVYKENTYKQVDGVAMGSPISPIVADVVMQRALETIMENNPLRIAFVKKYVDDLLLAIHEEDVHRVLEVFNSFHQKICFTLEREVSGAIPYLDMMLHRSQDGHISTTWYSKPISSQRMLNFHSLHPVSMILNVARNFVRRVRSLTSAADVDPDEIAKRILRKNDFPGSITQSLLAPDRGPSRLTNRVPEEPNTLQRYHSLSYIRGISERIRSIIHKSSSEHKISFKPVANNRKFYTKVKDQIPTELKSNVVYEIPCGGCSKKYIGTTSQLLKNRLRQHRRDCRPPIRNDQATALCAHTANTGHIFKFDEVRIIDEHNNRENRMFLEMLHIKRNIPMLISRNGTLGIAMSLESSSESGDDDADVDVECVDSGDILDDAVGDVSNLGGVACRDDVADAVGEGGDCVASICCINGVTPNLSGGNRSAAGAGVIGVVVGVGWGDDLRSKLLLLKADRSSLHGIGILVEG
ncbi:uncharacterized protein LOC129808475 [Phlebotomus papatasi]|uniref:uncharacterized protein LOC129808475 n=1 Tax=Phlebotomus papatasi TaxID=29031 RepID=UPI002483B22E|nr:uncharacterized protein LOC129808475 [Phlebotomus papatasi]